MKTVVLMVDCATDTRACNLASSFEEATIMYHEKDGGVPTLDASVERVIIIGRAKECDTLTSVATKLGESPNIVDVSVYSIPTETLEKRGVLKRLLPFFKKQTNYHPLLYRVIHSY